MTTGEQRSVRLLWLAAALAFGLGGVVIWDQQRSDGPDRAAPAPPHAPPSPTEKPAIPDPVLERPAGPTWTPADSTSEPGGPAGTLII